MPAPRVQLWMPLALLTLVACKGKTDEKPDKSATFPTPWEGLSASDRTVTGGFTAELGSDLPGAGWFETTALTARDASRAAIEEPGSTWPVVHIELFGWSPDGWNTLDLSVAYNHWVAGDVPVDGVAATGRLTQSDGSVRYLIAGDLHITDPGLAEGEIASGWFSDVVLSEVAR